MTPEEFKELWESNNYGGGITFEDVAECAKKRGLCNAVYTHKPEQVLYWVLLKAQTKDAEEYRPTD